MNRQVFRSSALALTILSGVTLFAPFTLADPAYDKCIAGASDNASWAQCGGDYVSRADAALNETWKKVYGQTSGNTKTDLLAEQRAWIAFREAACKFYANGDFGREGQVLSYPACVAGVIEERTKALAEIGSALQAP